MIGPMRTAPAPVGRPSGALAGVVRSTAAISDPNVVQLNEGASHGRERERMRYFEGQLRRHEPGVFDE